MMRQKTFTTACPKCRENGRDRRGNNLVWFSEHDAHCFACGYHVYPKHYVSRRNAHELSSDGKPVIKKDYHGSKVLPPDFTREVPAKAWKWLLQYGLPIKYWRPYVGYSESHSRLVLTCGDPVIFSVGRDLSGKSKAKWLAYGDTHKTAVSYGDVSTAKQVTLVEDLVSAHKVAQLSLSVPLFGTNLYPCHYRIVKNLGLPVVLWLDKDQEHTMTKKCAQISLYTGLPCSYVVTEKDPKELSIDYIKEKLT